MSEQRDYSLRAEVMIDREIDRFLKEGVDRARSILEGNKELLDKLANYLLEYETLEGDEFEALMDGRDPRSVRVRVSRPEASDDSTGGQGREQEAQPETTGEGEARPGPEPAT
jgi:cell division protease FtsH